MRWLVVVAAIVVTGCVRPSTTLVNDEGRRTQCSAWGWGVLGSAIALGSHQHCMAIMEARGYHVPGDRPPAQQVAAAPDTSGPRGSVRSRDGSLAWTLPSGWVPAAPPSAIGTAQLYAREPVLDGGAVVTTVPRGDVQDLQAHVDTIRTTLLGRLADGSATPVAALTVAGRPALRFEATGSANGIRLHYQFTAIEGSQQVVKLNAWMPASRFAAERGRIDALGEGLAEVMSSSRS